MTMNSVEATEMLTKIHEMLNSVELSEYMKVTDKNYSTFCWSKLIDSRFVVEDLMVEFDQAV